MVGGNQHSGAELSQALPENIDIGANNIGSAHMFT